MGQIRSLLDSINADETMTFDEFLEKLDLSEHQYLKAIRLSLKHSTLLLKRSPAEIIESTVTIQTYSELGKLTWIFSTY